MFFYVAVDQPKRNTRNEIIIKKPFEWKILESSYELEETYQKYLKDKSVKTKLIIEDQLFYADIANMEIRPIYWDGSVFEMRRGLWYSETSSKFLPCEEKLTVQVEQGFQKFANDLTNVSSSEHYKKYPLFGPYLGQYVLYVSEITAYIVADGITTKVAQELVGKFSKQTIWGTRLIREYVNVPKDKLASTTRKSSLKGIPQPSSKKNKTPCHLVLVIHGIGQKLFTKDGIYTFATDVADLRKRIDATMDEMEVPDRYMILPIQWREIVEFGVANVPMNVVEQDLFSDIGVLQPNQDEALLPTLDEIMLPTNPYRTLIKDVCLDILMYMTVKHKISMLKTVALELNRVHDLFISNFPDFSGNISLIGHSLGSLIAFDLLTMEPKEFDKLEIPKLDFFPNILFLLGSPLSMIRLLNGEIIRSFDSEKSENIKRLRTKYLYNIFHSLDPIAQRIEPLISRKFQKEAMPVMKINNMPTEEENLLISQLNPLRKRVDFVLQSGYLESAYQYLSSLSQHSNYWSNNEVTTFLAKELIEIRAQDELDL
eukprot:NODE_138_length_17968_cov_0.291175.p2 type:complete len:542 gc:universal NODE_138_length_17968_cov_0.291175:11865-10240(-)